jgi:hypothetical protein
MQHGIQLIIVGTKDQLQIVTWILEAAQYPLDKIGVIAIAKKQIKTFLRGLSPHMAPSCAVLVNQEAKSVPDAISKAEKQWEKSEFKVFCAIPAVEAWLFADDITALGHTQTQWGKDALQTLPLPEDIKTPKSYAEIAFGKTIKSWEFVKTINVERAKGRSPSLRHFLNGIDEMLGMTNTSALESVSRNISREVFAGLMREIIPADTVMWRTATGDSFTAAELCKHIQDGTDIGQQYSSDVLRVARDFLKRKANRKESE